MSSRSMRPLESLDYRKTGTNSYWDRWTTHDMRNCFVRLQRISQKMAKFWRSWAVAHLNAALNNRLFVIVLGDALVCQLGSRTPWRTLDRQSGRGQAMTLAEQSGQPLWRRQWRPLVLS